MSDGTDVLEKKAAVLASLEQGNSIKRAARDARMGRQTLWNWRKADPEFAQACADAIESGTDELEDVAVQRAKDGSDTLLIFMLKARRPEKYKERYEHRVSDDTFERWLDQLHPQARQLLNHELTLLGATGTAEANGQIIDVAAEDAEPA